MEQTKSIALVTAHKLYIKFSQLDNSFGTIMSFVISTFRDLNWDQVLNKKKGMSAVKMSLNKWIEFFSE